MPGVFVTSSQKIVFVDPRYFRPNEVDSLLGNAGKAKDKLGWAPRVSFRELVAEMVEEDLQLAKRDKSLDGAGFKVQRHYE